MILSYRDKRTERFANGKRVAAFSRFERSAQLRLDRLEAATSIKDLAALPGNSFEALKGDRQGQFSIRINDQWRICSTGQAARSGRKTSRSLIITNERREDRWHEHQFIPVSTCARNSKHYK